MKTTDKWVLIIAIVLASILIIYVTCLFASGPNDYIEQYEFNVNKDQLIESVETFKKQNNTYIPPPEFGTIDALDTVSLNFDVSFYLQKENTVIYCFINNDPSTTDKSSINLVSINKGLKNEKYRAVNLDLKGEENAKVKNQFRKNILDKLKLSYKDKGHGFARLW